MGQIKMYRCSQLRCIVSFGIYLKHECGVWRFNRCSFHCGTVTACIERRLDTAVIWCDVIRDTGCCWRLFQPIVHSWQHWQHLHLFGTLIFSLPATALPIQWSSNGKGLSPSDSCCRSWCVCVEIVQCNLMFFTVLPQVRSEWCHATANVMLDFALALVMVLNLTFEHLDWNYWVLNPSLVTAHLRNVLQCSINASLTHRVYVVVCTPAKHARVLRTDNFNKKFSKAYKPAR